MKTTEPVLHQADPLTTWVVEPSWRDRLFGPDAPDWFALETSPAAEHVKAGHEREVWRVRLEEGGVFAKIRQADSGLRWLGDQVARLTSSARREWETARRARAKGVPVVHFVALGHRGGDQPVDVLISEAIPNAETLAAAWAKTPSRWCENPFSRPPSRESFPATRWCENPFSRPPSRQFLSTALAEPRSRDQIIGAVARLFAEAHQRGFAHRDNHPHNILVYSTGDCLAAVFVDVIPAWLSRERASYRRIVASLAHLDQYFHRVATRAQRLRFLRAYLEALHAAENGRDERLMEHRLVPAILHERARHALRLARRRDQRIWRSGKYFTTFELAKGGGRKLRATVVLDLERRHLFPEHDTPDRSEAEWRNILGAFMDEPENAQLTRELARHGLRCELMRTSNLLQRLRWTVLGSLHRRAFAQAHQLRHRDIPAPLLLAYIEERQGTVRSTHILYGTI